MNVHIPTFPLRDAGDLASNFQGLTRKILRRKVETSAVLGADLVCPRTGDRYAKRSGALRRAINVSGFGEDLPDNPNEEPAASVG